MQLGPYRKPSACAACPAAPFPPVRTGESAGRRYEEADVSGTASGKARGHGAVLQTAGRLVPEGGRWIDIKWMDH